MSCRYNGIILSCLVFRLSHGRSNKQSDLGDEARAMLDLRSRIVVGNMEHNRKHGRRKSGSERNQRHLLCWGKGRVETFKKLKINNKKKATE